jgi:hypothetical protein
MDYLSSEEAQKAEQLSRVWERSLGRDNQEMRAGTDFGALIRKAGIDIEHDFFSESFGFGLAASPADWPRHSPYGPTSLKAALPRNRLL